jgi:hypothetical protein
MESMNRTRQFLVERPCPKKADYWPESASRLLPFAVFVFENTTLKSRPSECDQEKWEIDASQPILGADGVVIDGRMETHPGYVPAVCGHMGKFIE